MMLSSRKTHPVLLKWSVICMPLLFSMVACGGGISTALSLAGDNSAPISGISVKAVTSNQTTPSDLSRTSAVNQNRSTTITEAVFQSCQDTMTTPVTPQDLQCASGTADGYRLSEDGSVSASKEVCRIEVTNDGLLRLSINGVVDHAHRFSGSSYNEQDKSGSYYHYENKYTPKTKDTYPTVVYYSGTLNNDKNAFAEAAMLGFVDRMVDSPGPSTTWVKMWVAASTMNGQRYTCAGVLKNP